MIWRYYQVFFGIEVIENLSEQKLNKFAIFSPLFFFKLRRIHHVENMETVKRS